MGYARAERIFSSCRCRRTSSVRGENASDSFALVTLGRTMDGRGAVAAASAEGRGGRGATHFRCQGCMATLDVSGASDVENDDPGASTGDLTTTTTTTKGEGAASDAASTRRVDESFVVLAEDRDRARGAAAADAMTSSSSSSSSSSHPAAAPPASMAESFVVLAEHARRSTGDADRAGLNARFAAMSKISDMASDPSRARVPICVECAARTREEMDARARALEEECDAYERCLKELDAADAAATWRPDDVAAANGVGNASATSATTTTAASEEDVEKEAARLEAEARDAIAAAAARDELARLRATRDALTREHAALDDEERAYWHEHNAFKRELAAHVNARDALTVNIEQTTRQLARLRRVNVLNDAFRVWHDGPFGTVNGFRLGKLPSIPVEWDEINAGFGMACSLLHTIARLRRVKFTAYTLRPVGSFSKVEDAKGHAYELYGPVNILSSHRYDKAMVGFITCLKEFAAHCAECDVRNGVTPPFELPYTIGASYSSSRRSPCDRVRATHARRSLRTYFSTRAAHLSAQGPSLSIPALDTPRRLSTPPPDAFQLHPARRRRRQGARDEDRVPVQQVRAVDDGAEADADGPQDVPRVGREFGGRRRRRRRRAAREGRGGGG